MSQIELTILMPCLNESRTLPICIQKAKAYLKSNKINGEILVADNGSTDGSPEKAQKIGARVVHVKEKGYGAALMGGIQAAYGKYIIMGDSDDSYNFSDLNPFIEKLRLGCMLVMGNRFLGGIHKGAMPFLHRYLGNPILSKIGKIFFRLAIGDFHCGLRGFDRNKILQLRLHSPGMEFASEMVIMSSLQELSIDEVPVELYRDGRDRKPHLRTWRDGFRHLCLLLSYSPNHLFLYPGIFFSLTGGALASLLTLMPIKIGAASFETHTMLYAWISLTIGIDLIVFSQFTQKLQKIKGIRTKESIPFYNWLLTLFSFETLFLIGAVLLLIGLIAASFASYTWYSLGFSTLEIQDTMKIVIPSSMTLILGMKFIFFAFLFYILNNTSQKNNH